MKISIFYSRKENQQLWLRKADNLRNAIECTSNQILQSMQHKQQLCDKIESIKCTTLELEINKALGEFIYILLFVELSLG